MKDLVAYAVSVMLIFLNFSTDHDQLKFWIYKIVINYVLSHFSSTLLINMHQTFIETFDISKVDFY
jgi:hypothetical protein